MRLLAPGRVRSRRAHAPRAPSSSSPASLTTITNHQCMPMLPRLLLPCPSSPSQPVGREELPSLTTRRDVRARFRGPPTASATSSRHRFVLPSLFVVAPLTAERRGWVIGVGAGERAAAHRGVLDRRLGLHFSRVILELRELRGHRRHPLRTPDLSIL
eukprot:scaffold83726_cov29-Tisochrysis_lutea.AAC.6